MFLWLRPLYLNLSKAAFVICHIWTVSRLKHCSQLSSFPLKELFLIKDIWHRKRGTHFSSFNRLKFFFSWYVNSVLISTEDSTVHGVYINGKKLWLTSGRLLNSMKQRHKMKHYWWITRRAPLITPWLLQFVLMYVTCVKAIIKWMSRYDSSYLPRNLACRFIACLKSFRIKYV